MQVQRTNAVYSAWLTIPKLSEICWQALNYYYPKLKDYSPDKLLDIGIPLKFVQRLDFYDQWTLSIALTLSNLRITFLKARSTHCTGNYASIIFIWYLYLTCNFRLAPFFLRFYLSCRNDTKIRNNFIITLFITIVV